MIVEVFSEPNGDYLGLVKLDPERLPFKRFCGLFWWVPAAWAQVMEWVNR